MEKILLQGQDAVKEAVINVINELIPQLDPIKASEFETHKYLLKTGRMELATVINFINHIPGFNVEIVGIQIEREHV